MEWYSLVLLPKLVIKYTVARNKTKCPTVTQNKTKCPF